MRYKFIKKNPILFTFQESPAAVKPEPKNICHQGTKTRRILFCYSFLVSWCVWRKEKSFATKSTKFTIKKLNKGDFLNEIAFSFRL